MSHANSKSDCASAQTNQDFLCSSISYSIILTYHYSRCNTKPSWYTIVTQMTMDWRVVKSELIINIVIILQHQLIPKMCNSCFDIPAWIHETFWSRNQMLSWSRNQMLSWSRNQMVSWSRNQMVSWSRNQMLSWSRNQMLSWSRNQMLSWSRNQMLSWSRNQMLSWSRNQMLSRSRKLDTKCFRFLCECLFFSMSFLLESIYIHNSWYYCRMAAVKRHPVLRYSSAGTGLVELTLHEGDGDSRLCCANYA